MAPPQPAQSATGRGAATGHPGYREQVKLVARSLFGGLTVADMGRRGGACDVGSVQRSVVVAVDEQAAAAGWRGGSVFQRQFEAEASDDQSSLGCTESVSADQSSNDAAVLPALAGALNERHDPLVGALQT